jgi:hypothetical protein
MALGDNHLIRIESIEEGWRLHRHQDLGMNRY